MRVFIAFLMLMAGLGASAQVVNRNELRNTNNAILAATVRNTNGIQRGLTTNQGRIQFQTANTNTFQFGGNGTTFSFFDNVSGITPWSYDHATDKLTETLGTHEVVGTIKAQNYQSANGNNGATVTDGGVKFENGFLISGFEALIARISPTNTVFLTTSSNLQAAFNANPTATRFRLAGGVYRLSQTLTNPFGFSNISIEGERGTEIWWAGATNGTMVDFDSCGTIEVHDIRFYSPHTNAAARLVNMDQVKGGGTLTRIRFFNCSFIMDTLDYRHKAWSVMIATNSASNCEDISFYDCYWQGDGIGAGVGPCTNNVVGLFIGTASNPFDIRIFGGKANYHTNFIHKLGGQVVVDGMVMTGNSVNFNRGGGSAPGDLFQNNHPEYYRQHAVIGSNSSSGARFIGERIQSLDWWDTNYALFELRGAVPVQLENVVADSTMPLVPTFSYIGAGVSAQLVVKGYNNTFTTNNDYHAVRGAANFDLESKTYGVRIVGGGGSFTGDGFNGGYGFGGATMDTPLFWRHNTNNNTLALTRGDWVVHLPNISITNRVTALAFMLDPVLGVYLTNSFTGAMSLWSQGSEIFRAFNGPALNGIKVRGVIYIQDSALGAETANDTALFRHSATTVGTTNLAITALASNAFLVIAPGGLVATGIFGANISYDAATRTISATGGSGTPGGNSGAAQFNHDGVLAGTNEFNWDRTNGILSIRNNDAAATRYLYLGGTLSVPFYSMAFDTNWFRLQYDFGTSGGIVEAKRFSKFINIGSTANNTGTNFGDWYFPSNVTAGSLSSAGTVTAAGLTVTGSVPGAVSFTPTNGTSGLVMGIFGGAYGSNELRFSLGTAPTAGQSFKVHSVTAFGPTNIIVLTNGNPQTPWTDAVDANSKDLANVNELSVISSASVGGDFSATKQVITRTVRFTIVHPSITQSNLIISGATNTIECVGLTNVVGTNIVEEATGTRSEAEVSVRNPYAFSIPFVLPAPGAQHGYYWHTNGLDFDTTTFVAPPGTNTVLAMVFHGTNVYPRVTHWKHP